MTNGVPAPLAPELTPGEHRFLRYWSAAMLVSRHCDWRWIPGFAYHEDEEDRLRYLAIHIPRAALLVWMAASGVIFLTVSLTALLLIASVAFIAGWQSPASVTALGSYAAIAMVVIIAVAGAPLSIVWGGDIADRFANVARRAERSIDARLLKRIRSQLRRAGATLAVLFVVVALLWLLSLD